MSETKQQMLWPYITAKKNPNKFNHKIISYWKTRAAYNYILLHSVKCQPTATDVHYFLQQPVLSAEMVQVMHH